MSGCAIDAVSADGKAFNSMALLSPYRLLSSSINDFYE